VQVALRALTTTFHQVKTVHQVAETRSSHDRPVDAIMASREHYLKYGVRIVDWTIYFRFSLCYLMNGLDLMNGRRLGPKAPIALFAITLFRRSKK